MNHLDYIHHTTDKLYGCGNHTLMLTLDRFANCKLAHETDVQEMLDHAVNPELCRELRALGACLHGLEDVGVHARDWGHLVELCTEWEGEYADREYLTWLEYYKPELFEGDY